MPYLDAILETRVLASRDVRADLTPNETQRTTLIVGGCYIIAIAILWYVLSSKCLSALLNPRGTRHVPYINVICERAELDLNRLVFLNASPIIQYTPSSSSRSHCTRFVLLDPVLCQTPDSKRAVLACPCWLADLCTHSLNRIGP